MFKKGDTLIEVTLAVGIFSMVAIAVTSVMTSGTSDAQIALETTLARESIDTQAEALRFIQNSYASNKEGSDQPLSAVWQKIKENAITASSEKDLQFAPTQCGTAFGNATPDYAFVINPRTLSSKYANVKDYVKNTYISAKGNKGSGKQFTLASTYPRLVFGTSANNSDDNSALSTGSGSDSLFHAEGIYVIAVRDSNTTNIIEGDQTSKTGSAFYDFYIRTCWDSFGGEASSISTLVRLYDSDAISAAEFEDISVELDYNYPNGGSPANISASGNKINLPDLKGQLLPQYEFAGWCNKPTTPDRQYGSQLCNGSYNGTYNGGDTLTSANAKKQNKLYAVWRKMFTYQINYHDTYAHGGTTVKTVALSPTKNTSATVTIQNFSGFPTPPSTDYTFQGWSTEANTRDPLYNAGSTFTLAAPTYSNSHVVSVDLYPAWRKEITFDGNKWKDVSTPPANDCTIFNVNQPTSGTYCRVSKGQSRCTAKRYEDTTLYYSIYYYYYGSRCSSYYGSRCVAPSNGYLIYDRYNSYGVGTFTSNKPSSGTYCAISKGAASCNAQVEYDSGSSLSYGGTAPFDGYLVTGGGKNIETYNKGINLQGYCGTCRHGPYEVGTYYEIGKDDVFELSADLNTAGMTTHPGGYVGVAIGPLTAKITQGKISYNCQGNSNSVNFKAGDAVGLKITKYDGEYTFNVNNKQLGSCDVTSTSNVRVTYSMYHDDHCCSNLFNTQLTNIEMRQLQR